jgi:TPP-dependent pyruvate/acetoin dehydrogenase alpha subunit
LRKYLEHQGAWSEQDERRFSEEVQAELKTCIERAEAAPQPAIGTMFEQVFEHMPEHLQQQQRECVDGPRARKNH